MARLSPQELAHFRSVSAVNALIALASYAKRDLSFIPTEAKGTERWHATVGRAHFELLLLGPKFFDTRARIGGGGAIDLAIHLYGLQFKEAIALLRTRGL
ncbi:hypothetical protein [Azonexus sp. IMCC34839]|uniref:hypothetical protein n=1 Tax=Azonexus sp. IMCC34839 TaxID=3133695 RepID=UPI003999FA6A